MNSYTDPSEPTATLEAQTAELEALRKDWNATRAELAEREKTCLDLEEQLSELRCAYQAALGDTDVLRSDVKAMEERCDALRLELASKDVVIDAMRDDLFERLRKELFSGAGKRSLYQVWEMRLPALQNPTVRRDFLRTMTSFTHLRYWAPAGVNARTTANALTAFMTEFVCVLPCLKYVYTKNLPDVSRCVLPWVASLPPSATSLNIRDSYFTAAEVVAIHEHCPRLLDLTVTTAMCMDWGPYNQGPVEESRRAVGEAVSPMRVWWV